MLRLGYSQWNSVKTTNLYFYICMTFIITQSDFCHAFRLEQPLLSPSGSVFAHCPIYSKNARTLYRSKYCEHCRGASPESRRSDRRFHRTGDRNPRRRRMGCPGLRLAGRCAAHRTGPLRTDRPPRSCPRPLLQLPIRIRTTRVVRPLPPLRRNLQRPAAGEGVAGEIVGGFIISL